MKLEIQENEKVETLVDCLSSALEIIKEELGYEYLVLHHDDEGYRLKFGVNDELGLWVAKYTSDDEEVQ